MKQQILEQGLPMSGEHFERQRTPPKTSNNLSESMKDKIYAGIDQDPTGAMNPTGNIIRDAWVFGIIPEDQTCAGWTTQGIISLYDKVIKAWEPYGHLVSRLPPELQEKHKRIYDAAIKRARELGWDPELGDDD
jgi:hypothetical protein